MNAPSRKISAAGEHPPRDTVLIVEDTQSEHERTARLLTDFCDVKCASSAREALAMSTRHRFQCILLDIRLPDRSGFELIQELARISPVIALTDCLDEITVSEVVRLGAVDCLVKHHTGADTLQTAIRGAIEKRRMDSMARAQRKRATES